MRQAYVTSDISYTKAMRKGGTMTVTTMRDAEIKDNLPQDCPASLILAH